MNSSLALQSRPNLVLEFRNPTNLRTVARATASVVARVFTATVAPSEPGPS